MSSVAVALPSSRVYRADSFLARLWGSSSCSRCRTLGQMGTQGRSLIRLDRTTGGAAMMLSSAAATLIRDYFDCAPSAKLSAEQVVADLAAACRLARSDTAASTPPVAVVVRSSTPTIDPKRLAVMHALCALSPDGYAPIARMILSTARAEQVGLGAPRTPTHRPDRRRPAPGTPSIASARTR